jgi:hypothetical protein
MYAALREEEVLPMNKVGKYLGGLAAVLAALAFPSGSRADFNATVAGLVLNHTIPDIDLYGLGELVGFSPGDYSCPGSDTTMGFSQTLGGLYAGQVLNVAYTGNSTAFPGGAITWTSSGLWGAVPWSSSGSASFTFPTSTTFQIGYNSSLDIGPNAIVTDITISGADDATAIDYLSTTGTQTINGSGGPVPYDCGFSGSKDPMVGDDDTSKIDNRQKDKSDIDEVSGPADAPTFIAFTETITVVPEPSDLALTFLGTICVLIRTGLHRFRIPANRSRTSSSCQPPTGQLA